MPHHRNKPIAMLLIMSVCTAISVFGGIKGTSAETREQSLNSQQIIGRWEGIDSTGILGRAGEATPVTLRFTPTGKAIILTAPSEGVQGFTFDYSLNPQPKPIYLDLDFKPMGANTTVPTIAQFTTPQNLKIQLSGTRLNGDRPKDFLDELNLSRVSDHMVAAFQGEGAVATQLIQAEQSKEGEGKFVMTTLVRSASIYRLETGQFPITLTQLGLSHTSTQNYRFEMTVKNDRLTLIARPKKAGLRSYIGITITQPFREDKTTQTLTIANLCQSFRPSTIAPVTPVIHHINRAFPAIECGSGSEAVRF